MAQQGHRTRKAIDHHAPRSQCLHCSTCIVCCFKMASRIRNEDWKDDTDLEDDLVKYVSQNLYKREIVNLVELKYPQYAWSMRTLTRRLQYFDIKYIDYDIDIETVKSAVEIEMKGPGQLLGYRALHKKIREVHGLHVPRNLVYSVMSDINPQGLEDRGGVGQPKRPKRRKAFVSNVSQTNCFLYLLILEGYDALAIRYLPIDSHMF